ncbi:MAG TPA: N-acetylneuraminate synthase family protein [Candidatus Binatia bacterium]|nr:N-acetylneuraminate synthase family protein [Candidatus Binatia bacterium]
MRIPCADRTIGDGAPAFVIAEIGSNHDGSLERALALVDAAAAAGADAVKFQSFRAATLVARRRRLADGGWAPVEAYPTLERLEVPVDWHATLRDRAQARGVVFLSTPFDEERAGLLAALGVPAMKVASGDLTHRPLLRKLGGFGRPVLLSTGHARLEEIEAAIAAIEEGAGAAARRPPIVLLHCVSCYPLAPADANLRALVALRARFGLPVGWSDHSPGHTLAVGAVALGACVVEKHLTDDRRRPGPDHPFAMEPDDFRAMVAAIRELETGLGDGAKRPRPDEEGERTGARRSLHAARALPAGATLEARDVKIVRPAAGLPPSALESVVGRRLRRALEVDEPLAAEDVA